MTIQGYVPASGEKDTDKIVRSVRNIYENGASSDDVTNAILSRHPATINILDHGAGTGIASDVSDAIDAAQAAAVAAGGGVIYAPAGIYPLARTAQIGSGSVVIGLMGDGLATQFTIGGTLTEMIRLGPDDSSTSRYIKNFIKDISLQATGGASVAALRIRNALWCEFNGIRVDNPTGDCVRADANAGSSDPLMQGCLFNHIAVRNPGGRGFYFRGVKGTRYANLEADNCAGFSYYWDQENQSGGSSEITESNIVGCIAKNGAAAAYVLSGAEKHNLTGNQAYVCNGPALLFRPTDSGTPAASLGNAINGLMVRNCTSAIDTAAGAGVGGINVSNVMLIGEFSGGTLAPAINMRGWFRFAVSGVNVSSFGADAILLQDDASPPSGGSSICSGGVISDLRLTGGGSQPVGTHGIHVSGATQDVIINGISTEAFAGTSGYELYCDSNSIANVRVGNMNLVANTAAHEISDMNAKLGYFGVNALGYGGKQTLWLPKCTAPSTVSLADQVYVDTADGDMKVLFANGTTKTIQTN